MAATSLASLLVQQTKAQIYAAALSIAQTIGLPVTSWQPGDPTRSLFFLEAAVLEMLEVVVVGFISSGFLDYATGQWLVILAKQVFNVDVPDATFAETDVVLTNSGGGIYDLAVNDVTFKNVSSGKTYHNSSGGHLSGSGGTLTVHVIADEAGSASSAGANEITALVTNLLGVACTNPTAAVGIDQQSPATTISQCRNKLGSLSPNGPAAAYEYVAKNSALTGIQTITRARAYPTSDTGDVLLYVAGPGGDVAPSDVAAVQAAVNVWSTPLCITPTVRSATAVAVPVTYTIWVYQSVNQTSAQIQAAIQTALENMFAERPIGGDIIPPATTGVLYASIIESTIGSVYPDQTFRLTLAAPASDVAMTNGNVAELGTLTATVHIIPGP